MNFVLKKIDSKDASPTSICYSPDSRTFFVARDNHTIMMYDTHDYLAKQKMNISLTARFMVVSNNNFFLAVAGNDAVEVWNLQDDMLRATIKTEASVNDINFSNDNSKLVVLSSDGKMTTYDTKKFSPL